jgi:hypothetical protein
MFRVSISLNEIVVLRWFAVYLLTPIFFTISEPKTASSPVGARVFRSGPRFALVEI